MLRNDDARERSAFLEQLLADERNLAFELNEAGLQRQEMLLKPAALKTIQSVLGEDEILVEYVLDEPKSFLLHLENKS